MIHRMLALVLSLWMVFAPFKAFASQGSLVMPTSGTYTGLQFSNLVTDAFAALVTCNRGSSAPANASGAAPATGQCWDDTSTSPNTRKVYDGSTWLTVGFIDATNHIWIPVTGGGSGTLASATTVDLCSAPQSLITITGTTNITSFSNTCTPGQTKDIKFSGILTLTYNSSTLIIPSGSSITTAAGDIARVAYLGSNSWAVAYYTRADGTAISNPAVPLGTVIYGDAVDEPTGYVFGYGQPILRSTYSAYFTAVTRVQSGTRTSGNPTITGLSTTAGLGFGMPIEGTGIPAGTTISSVTSTTITMSANATSSGTSNATVLTTGYGTGGDSTTVGVKDCRGRMTAGRDDMGGTAANRITTAGSSINGVQINAAGGAQNVTLVANNVPPLTVAITDPGHTHLQDSRTLLSDPGGVQNGRAAVNANLIGGTTGSATTGITATANTGSPNTAVNNVPPAVVSNCFVRVLP
jgi:hypothetical protein